jgi:hypothetical protein
VHFGIEIIIRGQQPLPPNVAYLYGMDEVLKPYNYIPGKCNIGPDEIRKRFRIGYIGFALIVIFIILAEMYHIPQIWKLALFAPAVYAMSGFLQAFQRFCFAFGLFGVFSTSGRRARVGDALKIKKDRNKAFVLLTQVFISSLLVTLVYYFLTA